MSVCIDEAPSISGGSGGVRPFFGPQTSLETSKSRFPFRSIPLMFLTERPPFGTRCRISLYVFGEGRK